MLAWKNWPRIAAVIALVCATALAGCAEKKPDAPKAEGDPKQKKDGDITMDDLRAAAKAAGGDLDKPKPLPKPPESLKDVKPDFVFTAKKWYAQYEMYQPPFKKYEGKVIELNGVVDSVDRGHLYLAGGSSAFEAVLCPVFEEPVWKKALPGQTLVVRTRIGQYYWEILDVKGPPPDKLTAEELARAVATDAKGTEQKYESKYIIVSGVVEKAEVNEFGGVEITLKSGDGVKPVKFGLVAISDADKTRNKTLRAGMKMTVLGGYDGASLRGRCEVMELTP
ncbi:MAG: hypothetical protein J0I06_15380 [Planctomycetes bacterium]|nr:hypothetical protein [Planctomycetota bacterium]